ncbi:MAG: DUF3987 domain-containing protein [Prevotella sp.]|nr:DUF3987 domain-containing protein [Prevotella sp.]
MERTYYYIDGVTDNKPKPLSKEKFHELCSSDNVKKLVSDYQNGDAEAKKKLPAAMWLGTPSKGKRLQNECVPTQLYLIDIDHISDTNPNLTPSLVWESIKKSMGALGYDFLPRIVHETPSKDGLRMVLYATEDFDTLEGHAEWLREKLQLDQYGKFDCLKNLDRISFLVPEDYILFESPQLWDETEEHSPIKQTKDVKQKIQNGNRLARANGIGKTNNTDDKEAEKVDFFGFDIQQVIDERFKKGTPSARSQSRHDQSLRLARDLMVMLDRNKALTWQVLTAQPWVKEIMEERNENVEQTIESALGYIEQNEAKYGAYYALTRPMAKAIIAITGKSIQELKKDPNEEDEDDNGNVNDNCELGTVNCELKPMPTAPPVIRELISICPPDFVIPAINALMPILGTLTSYVRTVDTLTNKVLSTTFFSCIYAPPASGKSFVEMYFNWLLGIIMKRDELNSARDAVYGRKQNTKGANEKGDVLPPTSIRIALPRMSDPEFFEKMRNNKGHHMITYAAEVDDWKRGLKTAGGNKDADLRKAWDNGLGGQQVKSTSTFKGMVNMYWNVLICGTQDQVYNYFKNVTNGLVTRFCFTELKNQEFKEDAPYFRPWTKKERKVIEQFIEKCDSMTYAEPLDYDPKDCYLVADKDFDEEVPWQFTFKPFVDVDISWINSTVKKFNHEQCVRAAQEVSRARDTFRRRTGERGKRLALLCTQLYDKPMTQADKRACAKWIKWFMEVDIEEVVSAFGHLYEKQINEGTFEKPRCFPAPFELLPDEFTAADVTEKARKCNVTSATRTIIHRWKDAGFIEVSGKNRWKKKALNIKH